jgi:hypothetical protein
LQVWRPPLAPTSLPSAGFAAEFVRQRVLRILKGESRGVVIGLRRLGTVSGLTGRKRKKLERICRYLENNAHRMQYDQYLVAGYLIATGVIEGACRHLAKDRLERTGMHLVLDGAQAVLDLRSVYLSDQWDAFQKCRVSEVPNRQGAPPLSAVPGRASSWEDRSAILAPIDYP